MLFIVFWCLAPVLLECSEYSLGNLFDGYSCAQSRQLIFEGVMQKFVSQGQFLAC